jgi:hypothetical protein
MEQTTLLERLEAEAGELCAEAAREIVRLTADVNHWREARRVAIDCGEMMREELKMLREELKIARDEVERLRAKMDL